MITFRLRDQLPCPKSVTVPSPFARLCFFLFAQKKPLLSWSAGLSACLMPELSAALFLALSSVEGCP